MKSFLGKTEWHKRRHNAPWQELVNAIRRDGVRAIQFSLRLKLTPAFEYIKSEDEAIWACRGGDETAQKWWDYMAEIMETNADNSPVCCKINEVFYLD